MSNVAKIYRLSNPENNEMAFYSYTYGDLKTKLSYHKKKLQEWKNNGVENMMTKLFGSSDTVETFEINLIRTMEADETEIIAFLMIYLAELDDDFLDYCSDIFSYKCNCCETYMKLSNVYRHISSKSHLVNETKFIRTGNQVEIKNTNFFYGNVQASASIPNTVGSTSVASNELQTNVTNEVSSEIDVSDNESDDESDDESDEVDNDTDTSIPNTVGSASNIVANEINNQPTDLAALIAEAKIKAVYAGVLYQLVQLHLNKLLAQANQ